MNFNNRLKPSNQTASGFDGGFSILEALVAMVIASILGVGIMQVFNANNYLFRGEQTISTMHTNTRFVMDEMTRAVRMINLNPQETPGGVFGIQSLDSCTGSTGALTQTAIPAAAVNCIYFTRSFDIDPTTGQEYATVQNDSFDIMGFYLNTSTGTCPDTGITGSCPNALMLAKINPANGSITGWTAKFQNVMLFEVDYMYSDGVWASSGTTTQSPFFGQTTVPLPGFGTATFNTFSTPPNGNTTGTGRGFGDVIAVSMAVTTRSEKPHDLTKQYAYETIISTVRLRNRYYN